jgi:hypothetical protein
MEAPVEFALPTGFRNAARLVSALRNQRHAAQAGELSTRSSPPPTHPPQPHEHTGAHREQQHRARLGHN